MQPNTKNTFNVFIQVVVILAIGIGSIWIASFFSKKANKTTTVVECPLDTKSYQETKIGKNVILLENKTSYGEDKSFDGHDYNVLIKRTGLQSKIACGYLFYRISVGDRPIQQANENLYMTLTSSRQFGGHILPDEKNAISIAEVNNKTEVLVPLNSVYHDGTSRTDIKQADWASLLNVAGQISFNIALNTTSPKGHVDSVEIAYKCWNPQTGQETTDCGLEVVKE